jgi:heme-degrading monooxygenase HmoA
MLISKTGAPITLINVFETAPAQQQGLIEQWIRFVEAVKDEPDLIGTALHRSTDGTRVVNYAQWRTDAAYTNFIRRYRGQLEYRRSLALRVDPHLYDVIYLFDRAGE